jgi:WD40 repeat protein
MVKINGTLLWSALFLVFFGTTFGLVDRLGLPRSDDRPERPAGILLGEHQYPIRCLAFAPDGHTLATAGGFADVPREIKLWDPIAGTLRTTLGNKQNGAYAVTFSPDGQTLATISLDHVVTLWDVATGRELANVPASLPHTLCIVAAPNGETLAMAGCRDQPTSVRLWHLAGELPHPLTGGSGPAQFSADSRRLDVWRMGTEPEESATAPYLPAVQFWDIPVGQAEVTLRGDQNFVWALAFSPDGRTLATGGFDETVKLWDVASGRERITLSGHTDQIDALAFSPGGALLASGSYDRTVKLWDTGAGREVATFTGHAGRVTCVAFSPDRRWVASGSHDRTVRLWPVSETR